MVQNLNFHNKHLPLCWLVVKHHEVRKMSTGITSNDAVLSWADKVQMGLLDQPSSRPLPHQYSTSTPPWATASAPGAPRHPRSPPRPQRRLRRDPPIPQRQRLRPLHHHHPHHSFLSSTDDGGRRRVAAAAMAAAGMAVAATAASVPEMGSVGASGGGGGSSSSSHIALRLSTSSTNIRFLAPPP